MYFNSNNVSVNHLVVGLSCVGDKSVLIQPSVSIHRDNDKINDNIKNVVLIVLSIEESSNVFDTLNSTLTSIHSSVHNKTYQYNQLQFDVSVMATWCCLHSFSAVTFPMNAYGVDNDVCLNVLRMYVGFVRLTVQFKLTL